ncbi:histidine kinase [Aquabacterium lacunae]|uniref:histidine kinase n=1 Tax=Aquabacterium lacunae TaxID=2528630 RepID=A0A4Q9H2A1_9BURK|nr:ATP-binding protein [Aquabacterium lacunae]TBO34138.1 histidine kinase [Aquabacterium lacunae]
MPTTRSPHHPEPRSAPSRSAVRAGAHPDLDASTLPADTGASWFGGLEDAEASRQPAPDSRSARGAPEDLTASTRWWQAPWRAPLTGSGSGPALGRLYRAFLAARVALAVVLLAGLAASWWMDRRGALALGGLTLGYALVTAVWWWLPSQRQAFTQGQQRLSTKQALATLGVDLATFAVFGFVDKVLNLNAAALMALPVLMGAVLLPRFLAVATAAAATLIILTGTLLSGLFHDDLAAALPGAGLAGFGLMLVALMVSELSSRLAREQSSARSHQEQARQQGQLNRLVIEEMSEGVLVVDRHGRVRSANPSARKLLSAHGSTPQPPFQLRGVPAWRPLVEAIESAFNKPPRPHDTHDLALLFDDRTRRLLRMRVKFTRGRTGQRLDDLCVLFLEDQRVVQARARQDKLAAMGRMTAGIAHEVRNPLAAIAQANALLAEDATDPTQVRLNTMIADNVERLKRIVDDVLTVAPGQRPDAPAIELDRMLRTIADEWQALHPEAASQQRLKVQLQGLPPRELGSVVRVLFEPEHLRRVMVNLLDNAWRHSSAEAGAIELNAELLRDSDTGTLQALVSVASDGKAIDGDTERSLFEPFFSTRSRGTGLGLYISRELCERHGATLDYRQHPPMVRHRNEFYLLLPLVPQAPEQPATP